MAVLTDREFEKFFKTNFTPLTVYCNKMLHDYEAAKEVAHQSFVNIWQKRDQLKDESNIQSLLFRIGYNLSLNYIRDNKKFTNDDEMPDIEAEYSDPDSQIEAAELEATVVDTIRQMPEKIRRVFLLSRFDKLSNNDIAEKLSVSVKTVEAHITSALKMLRKRIFR